MANLKRLIWLYFWLLIFEGALRKWVVPGLAAPLLIIRDPVVIAIYFYAITYRKFPVNGFVISLTLVGLCSFLTALAFGHGNPIVAAFGWRSNFLHLPLIFVMGQVFDEEDVRRIGRWFLLLAVPMAVLMALQFRAGDSSWLNAGAGEGAKQIGGLDVGRVRPAGLFSYALGVVYFFAITTAFALYGHFTGRSGSRMLLMSAVLALIGASAVSGSRSFLAAAAIVVATALLIMWIHPAFVARGVSLLTLGGVALLIFGTFSFFQEGVTVMSGRIERAGDNEGGGAGFVKRFLSNFVEPIEKAGDTPLSGEGLGLGTSAGAKITTGDVSFLLAENEWTRVIMESGPLLGGAFLLWRVAVVGWLAMGAFRCLASYRLLPFLLLAASIIPLLVGQIGQSTVLGFAAFGGGLCLAAMRSARVGEPKTGENLPEDQADEPRPEAAIAGFGRGERMEW